MHLEYERSGTTLMEVLMSLLIMSIGVVTLATLFPISILRAVQATQLTNAAILRYNADALITALPQLVHDPDSDGNLVEHIRQPANRNYIVDPLGFALIRDLNVNPTFHNKFGNDGASPPASVGNLGRFSGGFIDINQNGSANAGEPNFDNEVDGDPLVTLPDSWVLQTNSAEATVTTTTASMPADVDLLQIATASGASRIHIFDVTGRFSHTRTIPNTGIAGQVVTWTDPIPAGFNPGEVRIETRERRYTWMLTVRKQGDGKANVDVVVFFRRPFEVEDEQVYTANFLRKGADGSPGFDMVDDDSNGTVDDNTEIGWPGSDDRVVQVTWTGSRPFMKRGGYVMDAANARWYRIQGIRNETGTQADLTLERNIIENGTGGAIMMRGIIEVYPIGKKSF